MVWILKEKASDAWHVILPKKTYTIGRSNADIILNDKSASRTHATLELRIIPNTISKEKLLPDYELLLKETSKFGSTLNGTISITGKEVVLKENDEVTFSQNPGITFQVQRKVINVFASCLKPSEKRQLRCTLEQLGGVFFTDWQPQCTFLVMSNLTATFKVICSLLQAIPIVKVQYFEALLQYYTNAEGDRSQTHPQYVDYLPVITDEHIQIGSDSFLPNSQRRLLFTNKRFLFLSQDKMNTLRPLVELGNGECHLLSEDGLAIPKGTEARLLCHPNSLLVYDAASSSLRSKAFVCLRSCNRRPIVDAEIGHAVLKNSLEYYCNTVIPCDPTLYKDCVTSEGLTQNPFFIAPNLKRVIDLENEIVTSPAKRPHIDNLPQVKVEPEIRSAVGVPRVDPCAMISNSPPKMVTKSGDLQSGNMKLLSLPTEKTIHSSNLNRSSPHVETKLGLHSLMKPPISLEQNSLKQLPASKVKLDCRNQMGKLTSSIQARSKFNLVEDKFPIPTCEEEEDPFDAIVFTKSKDNSKVKPSFVFKPSAPPQSSTLLLKSAASDSPSITPKSPIVMPQATPSGIPPVLVKKKFSPSEAVECVIKTSDQAEEFDDGVKNCGIILKSHLYRSDTDICSSLKNFKNFRKINREPVTRPNIHLVVSGQVSKRAHEEW